MTFTRWQKPLLGWTGADHFDTIRQEVDDVLGASFGGVGPFTPGSPAIDASEDQESIYIRAELPGFKKEDIDLHLQDDVLTISGEKKPQQNAEHTLVRRESFAGPFQRSITLPSPVNSQRISASYKDGVLTVTLPKAEEAKPRQITIN